MNVLGLISQLIGIETLRLTYIYIFHCINLMIIEIIQEVDAIGVQGFTL